MDDDRKLLRAFADEGSQAAFAEMVRRRVDLVYAAALRQVGGDAALAEEVTQGVFLALAKEAKKVCTHPTPVGWLYTSTRFLALKAVRSRTRWRRREREANAELMNTVKTDEGPAWSEVRPVLDEAMHELKEEDRTALLLRFFEGRPVAEIGTVLGVAENAARMRVDRALEKLRGQLARRGITSTASALGAALAAQPVVAAPVGLAASVAGVVGVGVGAVSPFIVFMSKMKIVLGIAAAAVIGYLGGRLQHGAVQVDQGTPSVVFRLANERIAAESERSRNSAVTSMEKPPAQGAPLAPKRSATGGPGGGGGGGSFGLPESSETLPPVPQGTLKLLVELQARGLVRTNMTFVQPDGKLSTAFAELFSLTSEEGTRLQESVDRTSEILSDLEKASSVVSRSEQGDVTIAVTTFPKEGRMIYDDLMKSFAETLGPERFAAYSALGAAQTEAAFGYIGTAQRTVTFSAQQSSDGQRRISVRTQYKQGSGGGSSTRSYATVEEAVAGTGTVGRLLPKDFGR